MRPAEPEARAASSCGVPAASPAASFGASDAQLSSEADGALRASKASLEEEISPPTLDKPTASRTDAEAADGTSQLTQEAIDSTAGNESSRVCLACGEEEGATERGGVLECADCQAAVHSSCYGGSIVRERQGAAVDGASAAESRWRCDCCARGVPPSATACVYCCQAGDRVMRAVEASDGLWRPEQGDVDAGEEKQPPRFAHLLCLAWDPRSLAGRSGGTAGDKPEEPMQLETDAPSIANSPLMADPRAFLPPGNCCLCGSSAGVRIQCRRVHCDRFFHAMCASKDGRGYLERVDAGAMTQVHAYCDRHRACREDVVSFLEKLVSKPVTSLVGREDARRFQVMLKRVATYTSIETLLDEIAALLVGFCNKGLRASRSDPPTYIMKHLQVLQLFLDHVPQLEMTYALQPVAAKKRVGDAKLYRHLVKTFNPPRYLSRFPGPLSQQHACAVCFEPFFERQHLFYCTNATGPHELHWQCTKRAPASSSRERDRHASNGSSSKKKKQPASNAIWPSLKQPNGLSSVSNGVVCGVCASPVDLRGLIASDRDAKRLEFEKKPTVFASHGGFINAVSQRTTGRSSRGTSPARTATIPPARSSVKASGTGGRASDSRSTRRLPTSADSAKTANAVVDEPAGPVELAPLKMERINVQRTARWLACVGQIIRLAGRAREAPNADASKKVETTASTAEMAAEESTEASQDLPGEPNKQLADEPMLDAEEPQTAGDQAKSAVSGVPAPSEGNQNGSSTISTSTVPADKAVALKGDVEMEDVEKTRQATVDTSATAAASESAIPAKLKSNGTTDKSTPVAPSVEVQSARDSTRDADALMETMAATEADHSSLVSSAMQAYFDEAVRIVSPFDPYALDRIETAREMLAHHSGPGVAVLRMLAQEYTRFVHAKHLRAVDKVRTEKRKREELEAQQRREREKKRLDREAELALKKKMLAMRKRPRSHIHEQA